MDEDINPSDALASPSTNRARTIDPNRNAEDYISDLSETQIPAIAALEVNSVIKRRIFGVETEEDKALHEITPMELWTRKVKRLYPSIDGHRAQDLLASFSKPELDKEGEAKATGSEPV